MPERVSTGHGPLNGLRILEFAGVGPGPFAGMVLADLGADVLRLERPEGAVRPGIRLGRDSDVLQRGKRILQLDLKRSGAAEAVLPLVRVADALIEGFRPGVMERLGLGPDRCLEANPKLVYGRVTGWGQDGPLAQSAGHDINYIAIGGALGAIGRPDTAPPPPLNLLGDYGGGGMLLALGIACGLLHARTPDGSGQVVDAAMVDGVALLAAVFSGLRHAGAWTDERGANTLDGGAHFYDTYETADGKFVAVGAIEAEFHDELVRATGLDFPADASNLDAATWPAAKQQLARLFRSRTQAEWISLMEGREACFSPVLDFASAPSHPHMQSRSTFLTLDGVVQPAPAPRFSRTPGHVRWAPTAGASERDRHLREWGVPAESIGAVSAACE